METEVLVHYKRDAEVNRLLDGKRNHKMTKKAKQYRLAVLEKRQAMMVVRTIKKSIEIDDFVYSYQNSITVKEELMQLNDMFRMLVEIHEENEEINEEYGDEIWFMIWIRKFFPLTLLHRDTRTAGTICRA